MPAFAALPPEINSGRMYSGPGAEPLLAAAAAWDGLSTELRSAGTACQTLLTELTTSTWTGPSATAMATAITPHITWLATTATQAEHTANQARATADAYETAFALTVPPQVVAANRTQLAALVATNILGQNTPAILTTEAHYAEMWAQDATAMHSYATTATTTAALTPFTQPTTHTHPTDPTTTTDPTGAITQALAHSAAAEPTADPADLSSVLSTPTMVDFAWVINAFLLRTLVGPAISAAGGGGGPAAGAAAAAGELLSEGLASGAATAVLADAPVSAGIGQADLLRALSVPPSWATAAPVTDLTTIALPTASAVLPDTVRYTGIGAAGLTGLAAAASARLARRGPGDATIVLPESQSTAGTADELRELAEIIESGILTDDMLNALLDSTPLADELLIE